MNLPDEDRIAILREIEELAREPTLEPHEITIRQYAESHKPRLTISQAASRLDKFFLEGVLTRREVLHDGKRKHAYSVPKEDAGRGTR